MATAPAACNASPVGIGRTGMGWAVAVGVGGFVLSLLLGWGASVVTTNAEEGASFIAIWFWMAGPFLAAGIMAFAGRWRCWPGRDTGVAAAASFATCLFCGILALSAATP